jgi:hypothetical protein
VGARALEGLDGISGITRGFAGGREINTVTFDPTRVSIAQMEALLKRAGTYRGTGPVVEGAAGR